jgi:hypothetical protein
MPNDIDQGPGADNEPARPTLYRMVLDHPRQLVDGALLLVMVGFLAAMMGVQHLDGPLHTALAAFVFAILCFVWSFYWLTEFWKSGPFGLIPDAGFVKALASSGDVADALGEGAFVVGFASIIAHLSPDGLDVLRNACLALLLVVVIVVTGALIRSQFRPPVQRERPTISSRPQPPQQPTTT